MELKYHFDPIKHIHFLGNKPLIGTTTCLNVLNKEGLTWWASGMACEKLGWIKGKRKDGSTVPISERLSSAGKVLEEIKNLTPGEYLEKLDSAYKAHNDKKNSSAVDGTDLHAEVEDWIKSYMSGNDYEPDNENIKKFSNWARENVKKFIFSEANTYSEKLWVGGIVDCLLIDKNDKICVLDFKSSSGIHTSQKIQTAGYSIQLEEKGAFDNKGERVLEPIKVDYCAIWSFGMDMSEPLKEFRLGILKEAFENTINLYKILESFKTNENF